MIEAQHIDQPPGHGAGVGGFAPAAQLADHRPARRRRPEDAKHVERHVIEQTEIGTSFADRQMLGQVAVRA
jgi:hypothetical protein